MTEASKSSRAAGDGFDYCLFHRWFICQGVGVLADPWERIYFFRSILGNECRLFTQQHPPPAVG